MEFYVAARAGGDFGVKVSIIEPALAGKTRRCELYK
jgi:hypothetical protein